MWGMMGQQMGRAMKRVGKATGNQALIEKGRQWQYGHMTPEQLMQHHPSAFLRTYAVRSHLEPPDQVGRVATTSASFQLRHDLGNASSFPGKMRSIVGNDGLTRAPQAHLHLVFQDDAADHHDVHRSSQAGANFSAAFLPMREPKQNDFGNQLTNAKVAGWRTGRITETGLNKANENFVVTTQLTGCTIAKRRDNMLHLKPKGDNSGAAMHNSLPRAETFGRLDYPGQGEEAFVMMKRKPDGHTRLYFQTHDTATGIMRSGKKDF